MARALERLRSIPYTLVKTGISGNQLADLNGLEVHNTSAADHYGRPTDVHQFVSRTLELHGAKNRDSICAAATLAHNLAIASADAVHCDGVWVALRSFVPGAVRQHRWHQDGRFFGERPEQFKLVVTLRGQATLLSDTPRDIQQIVKLQQMLTDLELSSEDPRIYTIQDEINGFFPAGSAIMANSQVHAAIFRVGKDGAFHSEPIITEPRWFVSIVPGTLAEVTRLKEVQDR